DRKGRRTGPSSQCTDRIPGQVAQAFLPAIGGRPCPSVSLRQQPVEATSLRSISRITAGRGRPAVAGKNACTTLRWQAERFDRFVRDSREPERTIDYVLANSAACGMENWPFTAMYPDRIAEAK